MAKENNNKQVLLAKLGNCVSKVNKLSLDEKQRKYYKLLEIILIAQKEKATHYP